MDAEPAAGPAPGGAPPKRRLGKKAVWLVVGAVVAVLLLVVMVWWYLAHRRECNVDQDCGTGGFLCVDGHCLTKGKANLEDKWKFMAIASVDHCNGVNQNGDLWEGGKPTSAPNFRGVQPRDFPCRPAAGMPGGAALAGGDWAGFCSRAVKGGATFLTGETHPPGVALLVEGEEVVIAPPFAIGGIVVRRNGTCYLMPNEKGGTISCGFILVESGGILQAGSTGGGGGYRVRPDLPLHIMLVPEAEGYWRTGTPASQYGTLFHNPGGKAGDQCYGVPPDQAADVACLTNTTSPKSIGVCFNGTLHFAGWVPAMADYALWRARDGDSGGALSGGSYLAADQMGGTNPWGAAQEGVPAELAYKPQAAYPATFTEIVEFPGGDMRSLRTRAPVNWPPGMQVAVSSPSPAWDYAHSGINKQSKACMPAPGGLFCLRNVAFYVHGEGHPVPASAYGGGVEVAEIASVERAGDGSLIRFREPLVFPHAARASRFTSARGENVAVDTYGHVGLVTRSIRIEGATTGSVSQQTLPPNYWTPKGGAGAGMAMGKMNTFSRSLAGTVTCGAGVAAPDKWVGPGGGVMCDQACKGQPCCAGPPPLQGPGGSMGTVYMGRAGAAPYDIYQNALDPVPGCTSAPPAPSASAWYGQDAGKCSGLDCVLGGTIKVMYAASFRLDGVELVRMGLPGNAGTLGQYSIHFHLAGWGRAFRLYTKAPRELVVANCANWRSFSRWVTLHGTCLATVRNNVFVLAAANGIYTEDGVECLNDIEHNLCLLAMSTGRSKVLADPAPLGGVFGSGGFDSQCVASLWLTNNNNHVCRNVFACNPGTGLGIWVTGESPNFKQGPANLVTGDATYRLPGLIGHSMVSVRGGQQAFREAYVPDSSVLVGAATFFVRADGHDQVRLNYKSPRADRTLTAYRLLAENVCYNCLGFLMEIDPDRAPISWPKEMVNDLGPLYDLSTFYMPANGDSGGSLLIHACGGEYPLCGTLTSKGDWVSSPRVFCQNLVYDMGGAFSVAMGGVTWSQAGGLVLLGDCFLGADYQSAPSAAKLATDGDYPLGPFTAVICDAVLAGPIPGTDTHPGACEGILLYGDPILSRAACTGSSYTLYARPVAFGAGVVPCNSLADGLSPSFLVTAGSKSANKTPLGRTQAEVAAFLGPLSVQLRNTGHESDPAYQHYGLRGLAPGSARSCAPAGGRRAVLYDLEKGLQWVTSPDGTQVASEPLQAPPAASHVPLGCAGGALDPEVAGASLPLLLTGRGRAVYGWLCQHAGELPGYTSG